MSNPNEKTAVGNTRKPTWQRIVVVATGIGLSALVIVNFFPSALEYFRRYFALPISSAAASGNGGSPFSPAEARKHSLSDARIAVHGMFVKDPYGCVYVFQYLAARLSLTPILDEQEQPICNK
jgi:hypothetical protein